MAAGGFIVSGCLTGVPSLLQRWQQLLQGIGLTPFADKAQRFLPPRHPPCYRYAIKVFNFYFL
jgi:hypothetical protein